MGRSDTPTKDRGKPYQRSPRDATPQRDSPGLFKSVFSRIMSPFRRGDDPLASPEKIAKRLTGEPSINDGDVFGDVEGKIDVVVHREHQAGPSKARIDAQQPPIAPIQSALSSLEPISPTTSTRLLSNFLARKAALGEGGRQTQEEEAAVKELLRRAEEDIPKSPRVGIRSESKKNGRGMFGPIGGRGLSRSGSVNVMASPLGSRDGMGSSTPLRQSVLLKTTGQPYPVSASPATPSFSISSSMSTPNLSQLDRTRARSAESGVRLSPVTGRPVRERTPRRYGGPGMGSVGGPSVHVGTSSWHIGSDHRTLGESSSSNPTHQNTVNKSSPPKLSDAASILVNILQKTAAESKAKAPAQLINPYEPLTFHIGSSGSTTTPQQSILKTRSRPSTLERARRKEVEQANEKREGEKTGDKRMSDWELIQVGMGGDERRKKRSRVDDEPEPPAPSASSVQPEHMEVDSSPRQESPPEPTIPEAYRPSKRFIVPPLVASSSPSTQPDFAPSTAKTTAKSETAIDIIMQTVKNSVPKPRPAEQTPLAQNKPVHPFSFGSDASFDFGKATPKSSSISQSLPVKGSSPTPVPAFSRPSAPSPSSSITSSTAPTPSPMEKIASMHPATLPVFTFVALAHAPDLSKTLGGGGITFNLANEGFEKFGFLGEQVEEKKSDGKIATSNGFTGLGSMSATSTKAPTAGWKCDLCGLVLSAGSVKCDICEAPKPGGATSTSSTPSAPVVGSNGWDSTTTTSKTASTSTSAPPTAMTTGFTGWGTAPPAPKPAGWHCETCGLVSSPSSVKCDICEAPKPATSSNDGPTTSTTSGFSGWGSAAPAPKPSGWNCGTCGLVSSPASVKCDICEAPKPTSPSSNGPITSATSGFSGWGSAAPPPKPAGWNCGTCGLVSSPASVKCDVCEAPKPASSVSSSNNDATTSTTSGFTGWGSETTAKPSASTTVSTGKSDEKWKCGLCGLMSGATSMKCDVCDEPRP